MAEIALIALLPLALIAVGVAILSFVSRRAGARGLACFGR